ncbi:DUF4839 domain-containing protein [Streptomyces pristinaespiralis]|uniref:DUF4839 domain-containing protein n=2 Tax=Streptomyces pristinaespiralis TaxID=38300 RepID=B5HFS4_STRE2|nr:DUF4839 domain-containing protein [Streptomyces pristinaespiralis]ALC19840.1 putative lipoprotein [Streptomyces pristinaespiralis]EDY65685.1 conserved hypothetical protein [Streptomyces pristinaespiralis ATCC 25486]QMU17197.1 DUF4839 domain-containing protein [Streptomyces pristinaespiralis]
MADEIKYEYKTVQTVRGTDGWVTSKMRKDGWELVEQAQGTLRTTLNFRRPKKPLPWLLIGSAAAVLVVLAGVIGVASALSDGDEKTDESGKSTAAASEKPSATPTPTAAESAAAEVITSENNADFAALLLTEDTCHEANLDFATKHEGRTVAFNGSIVHMVPHGDYETHYDFLLGPGDKGPQTTIGPAFKYEDVNVFNLNLTGEEIPATVGTGDKFRFIAKVGEFNPVQCLFHLDPVSTEIR